MSTVPSSPKGLLPVLAWDTSRLNMLLGAVYEIGYVLNGVLCLLHKYTYVSSNLLNAKLGSAVFQIKCSANPGIESDAAYAQRVSVSMVASFKRMKPVTAHSTTIPSSFTSGNLPSAPVPKIESTDLGLAVQSTKDISAYIKLQADDCALNIKDRVFMYRLPLEDEPLGSEFNDFHENCLYAPVGGVLSITDEGITVKFGDYYDDNNEHIAVFPYYVLQFLSKGSR